MGKNIFVVFTAVNSIPSFHPMLFYAAAQSVTKATLVLVFFATGKVPQMPRSQISQMPESLLFEKAFAIGIQAFVPSLDSS